MYSHLVRDRNLACLLQDKNMVCHYSHQMVEGGITISRPIDLMWFMTIVLNPINTQPLAPNHPMHLVVTYAPKAHAPPRAHAPNNLYRPITLFTPQEMIPS